MEPQRKVNKDNPKFNKLFAERLDALLAVQKSRPAIRPRPPPRYHLDGTDNAGQQNESNVHSPERSDIPNSRPKVLCTADEAGRKLVIREMIERTRTSRRLGIPRPDENIFSSTSHYVRAQPRDESLLSATVVMAPVPVPMAAPQRPARLNEILSTSVPMSPNIDPNNSHRQISASNSTPLLSPPPQSPDLIDFPPSDDSDSDDDGEGSTPREPQQISENSWTESRIFTDFSDTTVPTNTTQDPEFPDSSGEGQESLLEPENYIVEGQNEEPEVVNENTNVGSLAASLESVVVIENTSSEPEITSGITVSASDISLDDFQQLPANEGLEARSGNSQYHSTPDVSVGSRQPEEHDEMPPLSRASSSSSGISSVSYDSTPGGLKVTDKIVWFTENGVAESGIVQWVGTINERFHAGVEFENPVGNSSGKLKGKSLFECRLTHGRFVPVSELMFHDDYYFKPRPANNEPSSCPNGFPELNPKNDEDSMPFVCVICQDDLLTINEESTNKKDTKEMCTTKCGHLFHTECLKAWFKLKNRLQQPCPYCQRLMNISDTIRIFPVQGKR